MPARLTEALLDALEPRAQRYELVDEELPTFGVRVTPSGIKTFFVLYTLRGDRRKRRYTIGVYGKDAWRLSLPRGAPKGTLTARDEARRIIGLVARGEDPQGDRMGERGALLFDELSRRYLDHVKVSGLRTWRQVELQVNTYLVPAWKGRTAASIRKRDVLEVINSLAVNAPVAANRLRARISRIFRWGAEQDLVEHNPTTGTKPPAHETPGERVLTPNELGDAYRRCAGVGPLGDAVRLLILTWLRRAEVVELELAELREGLEVWEIPAARMKNERPHIVPLPPQAQAIIAARLAVHPGGKRLFVNSGGEPYHPDTVTHFITGQLSTQMGVARFTQRDLRRTCTSLGGRLGIAKDTRERILSHTDQTVHGKHYDRYDYLDEKREALERWAAYVDELAQEAALRARSSTSGSASSTPKARRSS